MKIFPVIPAVFMLFYAAAQEIIPAKADIHPEIYRILQSYPPLQKGGYRIEKFDDEKFIVAGIGKAIIDNNFFTAARHAELDAELQITKALNPTQITVEVFRGKSTVMTANSAETQNFRKKFVQMLVSSQTPFIYSCGFWQHGKFLYCARAVFVGDFEHNGTTGNFYNQVSQLKEINKEAAKTVEQLCYLNRGGTVLFKQNGENLLLTVAAVPAKQPRNKQLIFAKTQAQKNFVSFISGGKLEHQLNRIAETYSSSNGENYSRSEKRKNLTTFINGEFQFLKPDAYWQVSGTNCCFYLYTVKLKEL